ncbi:MAG: DUF1080 domain-containing protein [Acidobacteria bacterium]|nr:DUF1080 domain-containing protein [Acidobacteriota bacterium]
MRNRIAAAITLACGMAAAQPPKPVPGAEWRPLFNGKDLTGWTIVGPERWVVEDGTILGESVKGKDGFIKTEKSYKDFQAFLRFRCETPINSGFFYHSDIEEDISKIRFIQVEIDNRIGRHTGGLHGDHTPELKGRGWIVWPAPELETVIRPYEWNDMLVAVEGQRVRTFLNGVQMIDFTYPDPRNTDGIIALQIHPGEQSRIRFKDIYIRDLTVR